MKTIAMKTWRMFPTFARLGLALLASLLFFPACAALLRASETTYLRSKPASLSRDDAVGMILKYEFHHPANLSESGLSGKVTGTFAHQYESQRIQEQSVVIDHATALMWQQSGSPTSLNWQDAKAYVNQLNRERFAGFDDWRLPTLEELTSLLEFTKQTNNLYIAAVFDATQSACWSADIFATSATIWFVYFAHGYVSNIDADTRLYIRAVRSM